MDEEEPCRKHFHTEHLLCTRNRILSNIRAYPGLASQVVLVVKNLPANAGDIRDTGSIPRSGRSSGGGHGNPLQYSCLENPMERGVWQAMVCGIAELHTTEQLRAHTHGELRSHMLYKVAKNTKQTKPHT